MSDYDVVIIGGGPAGYNAAIRAGQLGLKVACVEKRVSLGGTCLNVGCIPSKALLNASHMFDEARTGFASLGIKVDPVLDLPQMLKQKDESVTALTKGVEYLFKKNKVDWLKGQGRLDGPGRVIVRASSGEETVVLAKNIVIATGSEPTVIPGVVVDQEKIVDSTGALSLAKTPKKMIVIGAGVIGLELGSVWRRLGAEVEVVEFLDRIMPTADAELAAGFQKIMARQGMKFRLSTKVVSATASPDGVALAVEPVAGGPGETLQADVVLVAVGRRPYTEGLGLETVGLAVDRRGVLTNEHFASGAPGVYVIGDVTQGPMLAHKGEDEAIACIERIAGGAGHVNPDIIPSVVYTHPEAAWVGKTEEELKAAGVAYKAGRFPFTANARARVNHEREGFVKILADAVTDRILGVHMIGPEVGEMIGEYCLAMEFGGASEDVARTSHPHPTRSEAGRQAAMGVEGWTMQA